MHCVIHPLKIISLACQKQMHPPLWATTAMQPPPLWASAAMQLQPLWAKDKTYRCYTAPSCHANWLLERLTKQMLQCNQSLLWAKQHTRIPTCSRMLPLDTLLAALCRLVPFFTTLVAHDRFALAAFAGALAFAEAIVGHVPWHSRRESLSQNARMQCANT